MDFLCARPLSHPCISYLRCITDYPEISGLKQQLRGLAGWCGLGDSWGGRHPRAEPGLEGLLWDGSLCWQVVLRVNRKSFSVPGDLLACPYHVMMASSQSGWPEKARWKPQWLFDLALAVPPWPVVLVQRSALCNVEASTFGCEYQDVSILAGHPGGWLLQP